MPHPKPKSSSSETPPTLAPSPPPAWVGEYVGSYRPGGDMWKYLQGWGYPEAFIAQHAEAIRKANALASEQRMRDEALIAEARRAGRAYVVREGVEKRKQRAPAPPPEVSLADFE